MMMHGLMRPDGNISAEMRLEHAILVVLVNEEAALLARLS